MSDLIAYKSNKLIEASYKLTLQEQRLLLACIGKLDPSTQDTKMTITVEEFVQLFPTVKKNAERDLQFAVDRLWERSVLIVNNDFNQEFRWIESKAHYFKGEARIEIVFSKSVMPYLTKLEQQFTKIVVQNISSLSSVYSIRIYELLVQYKNVKQRLIKLSEFRTLMCIDDKYSDFKSLKQWVISPSIKELNDKSNLKVTVEYIKKGRKIDKLYFSFEEKSDLF